GSPRSRGGTRRHAEVTAHYRTFGVKPNEPNLLNGTGSHKRSGCPAAAHRGPPPRTSAKPPCLRGEHRAGPPDVLPLLGRAICSYAPARPPHGGTPHLPPRRTLGATAGGLRMKASSPERVNDFALKIATVNGTGSASAN